MTRQCLKELFDIITAAYPGMTSLVCYTEAVFITNPGPKQIRRGFYRWVDKKDYEGLKASEVLRDTFTDLLDGAETKENEKLKLKDFMTKEEINVLTSKYPFLAEK